MEQLIRFDDIPFPLALKDVMEAGFTGIIFASRDQLKKGLIFSQGLLCAIQSNRTDELLGNTLVSMGIISEEENQRSLETARLERRKQGLILQEMGALRPSDINDALRQQTENRLIDIFTWEDGVMQKVAKSEIGKGPEISRNELLRIIRKGIMENLPFSTVIAALSPFADTVPKVISETIPRDIGIEIEQVKNYTVAETLLLGQDPSRALLALYCTGEVSFEESKFKALIDTLRQKLKSMKDQDPFEMLGVDRLISDGGLKRAYIKIVKENHPDTYSYADDPEVRRLANDIFTGIQKAYTAVNKIREGKPAQEPSGIDESLQAEIMFSKGMEYLKARDYQKALDHFKLSTTMKPEERLFMESYIKTLFLRFQNTGRGNALEVKASIRDGLQRFPESDTLYVILGWVLKKEESKKAITAFQKALEINRNNVDAQREIRLIQMRDHK